MRIKYLDVLKAFAIIAVVLYHSGFMQYGYLGVDLFLVINGYLITKSLNHKLLDNRELVNGRRYLYAKFEIDRIVRLLPPLLVAGAVCLLFGFFVMINDTYESLSQSVIATNLFGNNVVELIATGNYWAADKIYSPLMHTWYVGLVMQFYLIYPFLYFLARCDKQNPQRKLLEILVVLGIISLLFFIGEHNAAKRFYLLHTRFYEFAVGGVVALLYSPDKNRGFSRFFVYGCYVLLLLLFAINTVLLPANIKLLLTVALSVVLMCSQSTLENKVTGNAVLAKIGAASYSIFIWHQIILAFYRSVYGSQLTVVVYLLLLVAIAVLSWMSYKFIEQRTSRLLKSTKGAKRVWFAYGAIFVVLTSVALFIYKNAGVVKDIPELEVRKDNPQRGMWANYNADIYRFDKPFESSKKHWFVIGNSYGRDFVNIILESSVADNVEVSYCDIAVFKKREKENRFSAADIIFIASKDFTESNVHDIEILAKANGHTVNDVIVVGDKNFGETMEQAYIRRYRNDYYQTHISMMPGFNERNEIFKEMYGDRYIDLISMISNKTRNVRVFTEDNKFISSDCGHITRSGARFFAQRINWEKYFD